MCATQWYVLDVLEHPVFACLAGGVRAGTDSQVCDVGLRQGKCETERETDLNYLKCLSCLVPASNNRIFPVKESELVGVLEDLRLVGCTLVVSTDFLISSDYCFTTLSHLVRFVSNGRPI
jgi:hypothetical protein